MIRDIFQFEELKNTIGSLPLEAPEGRAKRKASSGGHWTPDDGDGGEAA